MGFGAPLDLSDILPAYREHLLSPEGTAGINFIDGARRMADPHEFEPIPGGLYAPRVEQRSLDQPVRVGNGPPTCTTRTTMVSTRKTWAWDVNGWYRMIGVPFPYVGATKGVLSRSYIASGGQQSAEATYYLKRLLNAQVRELYDAMPLGEQFLDDEYVQQAMKAKAQAEASRRSADGTYTKATAVLDEWGYVLHEDEPVAVDTGASDVQDGGTPEADLFDPIEWTFSYWLWRSPGGGTTRLEQWQAHLVSALSRSGHEVDLGVGCMGKNPKPYAVGRFDGCWVVFLNDKVEPTPELAASAAAALVHDIDTL